MRGRVLWTCPGRSMVPRGNVPVTLGIPTCAPWVLYGRSRTTHSVHRWLAEAPSVRRSTRSQPRHARCRTRVRLAYHTYRTTVPQLLWTNAPRHVRCLTHLIHILKGEWRRNRAQLAYISFLLRQRELDAPRRLGTLGSRERAHSPYTHPPRISPERDVCVRAKM